MGPVPDNGTGRKENERIYTAPVLPNSPDVKVLAPKRLRERVDLKMRHAFRLFRGYVGQVSVLFVCAADLWTVVSQIQDDGARSEFPRVFQGADGRWTHSVPVDYASLQWRQLPNATVLW